jgi:hypothetical protein
MRIKKESVELIGMSRSYSVEYERDNGDSISAVVTEMWNANPDSQDIEVTSIEVKAADGSFKEAGQNMEEEILDVFEENRRW